MNGDTQAAGAATLTIEQIDDYARKLAKASFLDGTVMNSQWLTPAHDARTAIINALASIAAAQSAPDSAAPSSLTDRTPQDYAIEHAEYLASAAERMIDAANDIAIAESEVEEGAANASDVDAARDTLGEARTSLRNAIYEFRKRRDRALTPPAQAPAIQDASRTAPTKAERNAYFAEWESNVAKKGGAA